MEEINVRAKEVCGLGWCALWLFFMCLSVMTIKKHTRQLQYSVARLADSQNRVAVALESLVKDVNDLEERD